MSETLNEGDKLVYNDGRGAAVAEVLEVHPTFIVVQFDDRADTNTIKNSDSAWWNHMKKI